MILIRGIHGSRLYNLDRPESDYDYWSIRTNIVGEKRKTAKQKIRGDQDEMSMSLSTYTLYLERSSHQCLELCFSQKNEVNLIKDFTDNYFVNFNTFIPLYRRTIRDFLEQEMEKSNIHAMRMCMSYHETMQRGRFNPSLDENQVDFLRNCSCKDARALIYSVIGGSY